MKKHIANSITGFRILCSVIMLFFSAFSVPFFILYLFGGFSDMVDGAVARRTNSISEFGMRFDTVADFIFVAVFLIKFLPLIHIPRWLWIWIAVIAVIKATNLVWGFVCRKKLVDYHSVFNKATGLLLFLLPFTLQRVEPKYSFAVVCIIATIAAIQEGYYTIYKNDK